MKTRFIVAYDIRNEERLRRVGKVMKGRGPRLQYSVYQCDLSEREKQELISDLTLHINMQEDQVLFINIGGCDTPTAKACISWLGTPYTQQERKAIVL